MNNEDIKSTLSKIDEDIIKLQSERNRLSKILSEQSDTLGEKFKIWMDSDDKIDEEWLIDEEEYPVTRAFFDKHRDLDRHMHIDICEMYYDDFEFLIDPKRWAELLVSIPGLAHKPEYEKELIELAKEIMENNLGSFTVDW